MYTFAIDLSPPLFREVKEAERKKYIDELGSYKINVFFVRNHGP